MTLATVNAVSARWGTRIQTLLSVAKLLALVVIIVIGVVMLAKGMCDVIATRPEQSGWLNCIFVPHPSHRF